MKTKLYIAAAFAAFTATAQVKLVKEANLHYKNLEYHTAALQYEQYLKTKQDNVAEIRLAECYYHMNHFPQAGRLYSKAIQYQQITDVNLLQYAHILKHNQDLAGARKMFSQYLAKHPTDAAAKNELRSCDSIESYNRYSYQYIVNEAPFNSKLSDFSPVFYKDGIVFCSERSKVSNPAVVSQWTGHAYLDLYLTKMTSQEEPIASSKGLGPSVDLNAKRKVEFTEPISLSSELNSTYNEGPACFTSDGNTIYFTRNMTGKKNKLEAGKESVNNFEIYSSSFYKGSWSQPELLNIDNKNYSVGHPALSKDERRLYFVSDMPGGFGGTDIYYTEHDCGKWSAPVNAGAIINTSENEMFPVIHVDANGNELLYFSSEGHPGMGGLDLYYSVVKSRSQFESPVHLNAPLNSTSDDFGIIFSAGGNEGYFSSNRGQEDGSDKILTFKKYMPEFFVEVTIYKKGTKQTLDNTLVHISDLTHNKQETVTTDKNGKVFRQIDQNSTLLVKARKDNFFASEGTVNNLDKVFTDTVRVALELDPIVINKPIRLDNIYYDYDKWVIRKDATPALDKLVKIMKENPGIHVELSSHTDSRGKDAYNMKLSQKRAESAVEYIVSQGIAIARIYARGYGESVLLNHCKNGVKCSEEEHQLNRRTEFKVVKIINEVAPLTIQP
jgi:outer membrane protein OmpA-like peptidoglycan-associated protein